MPNTFPQKTNTYTYVCLFVCVCEFINATFNSKQVKAEPTRATCMLNINLSCLFLA